MGSIHDRLAHVIRNDFLINLKLLKVKVVNTELFPFRSFKVNLGEE